MSKVFSSRRSTPSSSNKYYYKNNPLYKIGYGLPNCVCYAFGRFYELLGTKPKLSTNNAELWWGHRDGYKRGQTPKLGAVACWRKGKVGVGNDGAGHVAIVEQIYSDGSILISESGYNSFKFRLTKLKKGYKYFTGYTFQGFIYNPIDFVEKTSGKKKYNGTFPTLPSRGWFRFGDRGAQVKNLQKFLNWALGIKLEVDGIIGQKTINAIKSFQRLVKITIDGEFGKNSLSKAKSYAK